MDPVVSKEKTISTGPPGGAGTSTLAFLAAEGSASFLPDAFGFGVSSSLSEALDGAERFVPPLAAPAPLPLAAGVALEVAGSKFDICILKIELRVCVCMQEI